MTTDIGFDLSRSGTVLETLLYRAPLALAPVDLVTGEPVADGLVATAWPATGDPAARWTRTARRSPLSALLGFGSLPGLATQERTAGPGSATPPWPAAVTLPVLVGLVDLERRYLPQVVATTAPHLLVGPPAVAAPVTVLLSSAATRPRPSGYADVTGEVRLPSGAPAPWAVVTLATPGVADRTAVCDGAGRFVHHLQYPDALPPLAGSPPVGGGLGGVTWGLTFTVRSSRGLAAAAPGQRPPGQPLVPETGAILAQPTTAVTNGAGAQTLAFGARLRVLLEVNPP